MLKFMLSEYSIPKENINIRNHSHSIHVGIQTF